MGWCLFAPCGHWIASDMIELSQDVEGLPNTASVYLSEVAQLFVVENSQC